MPSSFMVKRNYAHCPLKKRPLALYNEPASAQEQEEPQDLRVKKPRLTSPPPPEARTPLPSSVSFSYPDTTTTTVSSLPAYPVPEPIHSALHVSSPAPSVVYSDISRVHHHLPPPPQYHVASPVPPQGYFYNPKPVHVLTPTPVKVEPTYVSNVAYRPQSQPSQENLPSLAEYYLQLFKATSEAESKKNTQAPPSALPWQTSTYLPPSPQSSPNTHDAISSSSFPSPSPNSTPKQFYPPSVPHIYPDTSALISPVSTCSSTASESEDEHCSPQQPQHNGATRAARYVCDSCGKSYSTQSGLRKHSELHCSSLGPRAFACKHCAKAYTSIGALKMHIRTHTLPCKCHVCGKAFSRPWLLQGHIRTHTGEKPFECQQCHRSFADRSNLRAHQQTHERVKKYACHTCKKTFSRMSLLNKHSESACMGSKFSPIPEESQT